MPNLGFRRLRKSEKNSLEYVLEFIDQCWALIVVLAGVVGQFYLQSFQKTCFTTGRTYRPRNNSMISLYLDTSGPTYPILSIKGVIELMTQLFFSWRIGVLTKSRVVVLIVVALSTAGAGEFIGCRCNARC